MLPIRDALVYAMDATPSPVEDVTEALVMLLVAHAISENLDPETLIRRFRDGVQDHMLDFTGYTEASAYSMPACPLATHPLATHPLATHPKSRRPMLARSMPVRSMDDR